MNSLSEREGERVLAFLKEEEEAREGDGDRFMRIHATT
jgi:hypothetical protein